MIGIKIWFRAKWMFLKVLLDYKESVTENELTLRQAWDLCHAMEEAKYYKSIPLEEIDRYE